MLDRLEDRELADAEKLDLLGVSGAAIIVPTYAGIAQW